MSKKEIILLCGKSGAGKDFLVSIFNMRQIITHTTRPRRDYEIDGVHKHFHDYVPGSVVSGYDKNVVAKTKRGQHWYWTIMTDLLRGDVYIIDVPGIKCMLDHYKVRKNFDLKVVYIDAPLFKRILNMRKRGEKWIDILRRLWIDHHDFKPLKNIDHVTVLV